MIRVPVEDSWSGLLINCMDGIAKWDYLNCRWCWHMPPSGFEVGDPVPHEWDFNRIDNVSQSETLIESNFARVLKRRQNFRQNK